MAFGLTICAIFTCWKFTAHDSSDWNVDHTELKPAYTYYDLNRDAPATLSIRKGTPVAG